MIRRSSSAERRWSFDRSGSERRAEKAKDRGQVFVERLSRVWLVAGALSIECKQSEQSIGVVAMWWTLCSPTRTSLPATGSFLRYADMPSSLRGLSLSLSLVSKQRTRSDISNRLHRLSLSRSFFSLHFSLRPTVRMFRSSYSGVKLQPESRGDLRGIGTDSEIERARSSCRSKKRLYRN